ncbi:MAG: hypothetical protein R3C17_06285 [Planctomycetaceae bacterium]
MHSIIGFSSLLASLTAVCLALSIRAHLYPWTVRAAWSWMIAALLALTMNAVVSLPLVEAGGALVSWTAWFAATMLLTPLVTIPGARRPGIFAWHWFVVLPLVGVLQLPAISQLYGNQGRSAIEVSAPAVMGIVVVLLMSAGALLGTRSSLFAIVYATGIGLLLIPRTTHTSFSALVSQSAPLFILFAIRSYRRNVLQQTTRLQMASTKSQRLRIVIELFSGLYGISWAHRVCVRINQFGQREKWTVQLTATGFKRPDGTEPSDEELQQPHGTFVWVLSRFVDEDWLRRNTEDMPGQESV